LLTGSIQKIDARITHYQRHLSVSFRLDPYRPKLILGMAVSLLKRHMLSNLREDLDKSLVHFTESILLPPSSWLEHRPLALQALFLLSLGLIMRSSLSMQPQDAIDASKYLRLLRDQPQQAFGFPRHQVTTLLMDALAFKVELEAGNVMQNIGEMAVLCRELLTLDTSNVDTTPFVTLIVRAVLYKISLGVSDQPLDQLIESLRAARNHRSDLREARFALALCLGYRYCAAFVHDDYVEAASVLDEIITSSSPGNEDKLVAKTQEFAKLLEILRLTPQQTMEYSEATNSARAFLGSPSIQEPFHTTVVFSLEEAAKQRFRYFDSIEGFEAPAEHSPLSQAEPVFSFVEDKDDFSGSGQKMTFLVGLLLGIRYKDIAVIDEDIEKGRVILAVSASEGLDASFLSELFGKILFEAFKRTKKIGYLDESIRIRRQVRENPLPQFLASTTRRQLSLSLLTRLVTFPRHRAQDLDDALELVSQCVHDGHVSFPDRFQFACEWAYFARLTGHPSVSMAYETALSLMQDILHSAPTVQLQHTRLAMTDFAHGLPMDYASYQVDLGQLQDTIKTLERGRALLWSEMRRLRNSADQILQADPQLGHKFAAINRDLEELTQSITPSHKLSVDDGSSDDLRAAVPFGRLLLNHRRLLEERDKLISQIQALPAFDSFLTSPSFETLRSAASSGPVIIINHSRWRSDIIVLLHNTPPSLIPTPHDLYDRAITLKDKLLASREKYGFNSNDYEQTLSLVLAELYKLVGKPVIDRLRQLQVPEQSRVWWCPTSVFCSLPLHAMGPIPSDDGEKRYFLDLYICSYTTTLSALIQSRDRDFGSLPTKRPSLLLVAPANPSLPAESGEIQVVQSLDAEVTSLISEAATPAAVIDGFRHHQFIHIAGYGKLEPGKPFEAGFELHGGERLTLLEIVRLHFPAAEFAFLSASHTAELTEGSVADEGLHLVAAVQYCGFRSVVGTMWSMADVDGRDLAGYIYQKLFSSPGQHDGIPYSERSAAALQFAVKKMRRTRRITLERWVNFVHYGA
jgi:CHAT domain-containing protein